MPNLMHTTAIFSAFFSQMRGKQSGLAAAVGLARRPRSSECELERRGAIVGYHASVNLDALSRPLQAMVAVRIRPKTQQIVDNFVDAVWALPQTLSVSLMSGQDDILVHLSVQNTDALRRIVLDEIASLPGVVDETTSLVFEHRRKQVIEPG
ncbi:MAG: Lrp/AsnC family transcriptional regulator [Acidimicrobiales bacterium]